MPLDFFPQKCRELLAVYSLNLSNGPRRAITYHHDEEPDLVPDGMYAVVSVELRPLHPLMEPVYIEDVAAVPV